MVGKKANTVLIVMAIVVISVSTAIKSDAAPLTSKFFANYSAAGSVMSGSPYNMNDPNWLLNYNQNRSTFAYKVFAALFMLGYQTQQFIYGSDSVNTLKVFQTRNNLPVSNWLDAQCLQLLDSQLTQRETHLAGVAANFTVTLSGSHMQRPAPNDVSADTVASIFTLPMKALPPELQMSPAEEVQCISGQCVGWIKDSGGVNDAVWPVDLNSNYLFVANYFNPLVSNSFLPSPTVLTATVLHEYGHYLDGLALGWIRNDPVYGPKYASQPHVGSIDNRGFYNINYDMAHGNGSGCYPRRSDDVKDWISLYGYLNYANTYCPVNMYSPYEEWAEAFAFYVTAGRDFRAAALNSDMIAQKYNWLKVNVFSGIEYDTDLPQGYNSGCTDLPAYPSRQPAYMHCNTNYVWDYTLPYVKADGVCGPSAGGSFFVSPTTGLCSSGIHSSVDVSNGSWTWTCGGLSGGTSQQCSASINPGNPPGPPTGVMATAGNALAVVTFAPPGSPGDSPITGYTVTSIPAGGVDSNAGSLSLSHTVTGLANGTSYTFTVTASNSIGPSVPSTASSAAMPALSYDYPTIAGSPLPATVNKSYLFVPGSTKATHFTLTGSLPHGLNFSTTTGAISGTPDTVEVASGLSITAHNAVTDQNNGIGAATLGPFSIAVGSLPTTINATPATAATVGENYPPPGHQFYISTTNAIQLIDLNSALPEGLTLVSSGAPNSWSLEGIPTTRGVYPNIVIRAIGAGGYADLPAFTITVKLPQPTIAGIPVTIGMVGKPYSSFTPDSCGQGSTPAAKCYAEVYSIDTGNQSLPAGLDFDPLTGTLSGTPTAAGTITLTISASNTDWQGAQAAVLAPFTLTVAPQMVSNTAGSPLGLARQYHTATSLPNGYVLVTGGRDNGGVVLKTAEIYDSGTGQWRSAGSMATPRAWHAATLLKDGTVLVTGGVDADYNSLASAEIYDPQNNVWLSDNSSSMTYPRSSHAITVLADGHVVAIGGNDTDYIPVSVIEIYEPTARSWSVASPMPGYFYGSTVTSLGNGKVLVVGLAGTDSATLYDPANEPILHPELAPESSPWSTAGTMTVPRFSHTATVLGNGVVMVAGGVDMMTYSDVASAELYDPGTNTWSSTGAMATVRQNHQATALPDGTVLVIGGSANNMQMPYAELFQPADGTWSVAGYLLTPRSVFTASSLAEGNVLIVGGSDANPFVLASTEIYHYGYRISTAATAGGSITPSQFVVRGADAQLVSITPAVGYQIFSVDIDGVSQTISNPDAFSYMFAAVNADHVMTVTFALAQYFLNVAFTGSGGGTVSDAMPNGYSCAGNPCPEVSLMYGSQVTYYAVPDSNSTFTGWSQECGVTGNCVLIMSTPMSIIASFDRLQWVKNDATHPPYYGLLANAYKNAGSSNVIKAQARQFNENLLLDRPVSVRFEGGYGSDFQTTEGFTTVNGSIIVSSGKITVQGLKLH